MHVSGFMIAKDAEHFLNQRRAIAVYTIHLQMFPARPFKRETLVVLNSRVGPNKNVKSSLHFCLKKAITSKSWTKQPFISQGRRAGHLITRWLFGSTLRPLDNLA